MTQYNNLNVKLPNSQIIKFKLEIKNGTEVILNLSPMWLTIIMTILIFRINYY